MSAVVSSISQSTEDCNSTVFQLRRSSLGTKLQVCGGENVVPALMDVFFVSLPAVEALWEVGYIREGMFESE